MKPQAIRQFDFLYLGGYAVAIVGSLLGRAAVARAMTAAGVPSAAGALLYGSIVFGVVIVGLLWFFTSPRHSSVAKWIALVFVAIGLLSDIRGLATPASVVNGISISPNRTAMLIGLVGVILQAVGIQRLFTPEGRRWFGQETPLSPVDAQRGTGTDWSVRR